MEYYDTGHFDILDDETELADLAGKELDRYFISGHFDAIMNEQYCHEQGEEAEMMEIEQWNDDPVNQVQKEKDAEIEEVLSQKLSQLSTHTDEQKDADDEQQEEEEEELMVLESLLGSGKKRNLSATSPSTLDAALKKFKNNSNDQNETADCRNELETELMKIPFSLSTTNPSFLHWTQQVISQIASSITIADIQQVALLMYRLALLRTRTEIANVYLKSGTGTLRKPESESESEGSLPPIDRRVWPAAIQTAFLNKQRHENSAVIEINSEEYHKTCDRLTYEHLQHLSIEISQHQQDFDEKKKQLIGFTAAIEAMIKNYVHQMLLHPLKLKTDFKTKLLEYEYDAEIIKRKFLRENPNEYQINLIKRIYKAREDFEKVKRQLIESKQRVIYNKRLRFLNSSQVISNEMVTTARRSKQSQQLHAFNQQMKLIREKRLDFLVHNILELETQSHQNQKVLHHELSTMYKNQREPLNEVECMTMNLIDLVELRLKNITDEWTERFSFRFKYYLICPFGDFDIMEEEEMNHNTTTTTNGNAVWLKNLGFQPHIFLGTLQHSMNPQQLKLLSRGPTYVPPYQLHASSLSMDDILRKQYAPLKHQLALLYCKYDIVVHSQLTIQNDFYEHFKRFYSVPLPPHLHQRAIYEKNLVASIHQTMKKNNLLLRRTADNMNTFYMGSRSEFDQLTDDYLAKTDNYELFYTSTQEHCGPHLQYRMTKVCEYIHNSLLALRRRRDIDDEAWKELCTTNRLVKLSYLDFLPDLSKNNDLTLVPTITSSSFHMSYKISQFLDKLLRPFAQRHMASGVFQDEIDFIQQLNKYAIPTAAPSLLTPTTLFCTIKILNYSILDTHDNMIQTICNFIQENVATNMLGTIRIDTIKNLLQLCLYHTVFCYKNKLYKFIRGGPTTLPLMDTLSNIYLFAWQRKVLRGIDSEKEFFGRYKDQLFLTWHYSKRDLDLSLQEIIQKYPHIHLETSIGFHVNYLHASISNENGHLITHMYHDPSITAYTLPYVLGHGRVQYSNWFRTALIRAVCTCSSIEDFNRERIRIELTYLASGYSYNFIESHLAHLYTHFRVDTLRYDYNPTVYNRWRQKCFDFVNIQRIQLCELRKRLDTNYLFRLHYIHEYGRRSAFLRRFYDLWLAHFHQHPVTGKEPMQVVIFTKHLHSLNALLTQ